MKTYDSVYVFGDSYSTPDYCVDVEDSFWHNVAKDVGANTVHNYSHPGNSFESVTHLITTEHEKFDWNGLFLIGIPPLERMTFYNNNPKEQHARKSFVMSNDVVEEELIRSQEYLRERSWRELGRDFLADENRGWTEARVLRELYLLESWLRLEKKANCVFINLSKKFIEQDLWPSSKEYVNYFMKLSNAIIFGDKTYHNINLGINKPADYDRYRWDGHHGATGNEYFYNNSLKPTLFKSGLL